MLTEAGKSLGRHRLRVYCRTMDHAAELAMAERHVRRAEAIVSQQTWLVGVLRRARHDTRGAEQILKIFEGRWTASGNTSGS
jgi:hypothetical protein